MPSLGLCSLAAYVKNKGHEAKIVDIEPEGKTLADIIQTIKIYSPGIIAISSTSPVFPMARLLAQTIKENFSIPIVIGGAHPTVVPEQVMIGRVFDFAIIGEGEETLLELVNNLGDKESHKDIAGLAFRANGNVIINGPRPPLSDLDTLPIPDRRLLDLDNYTFSIPKKGIDRWTLMMTNRGCPFSCIFCAARTIWGAKIRYRSIPRVLDEIKEIVNDLNIKHINISDDTLTLTQERTKELCQAILGEKLEFTWEGMTRANTVDEKLLQLMKKAGLVRLSFGIESGDPEILEKMKKGVSLGDIITAYELTNKLGIETRGSVMIGNAFETKESLKRTLKFIRRLKGCMQMYINIATPYPGTELYHMAKRGEGGITLLTEDLTEFRRYGNAVMQVNDLNRKDLIRWQKIGFWMFYLTPRRIIYNLKRAGLRAAIRNVIGFIRSVGF